MSPRERERRLAALEAAAAARTKAAASAAIRDLLTFFTITQLRVLVHAARDVRDGKLTEAEAAAAIRACPGITETFESAGAACPWVSRP